MNMKSVQAFAKLALLTLVAMILGQSPAWAATRTASVNGNWNNTATWGGSSVPGSADSVTINAGIAVTVPSGYAAQCTTINFTTSSGASSINLADSSASLAASGAVTIQRNGSAASTINVGAGTFSAASVALSATTGTTRLSQILISTGTVTVSGNITSTGVASKIVFSNSGTLNAGGTFLSGTTGTFTASTGTVNYNGSAQAVGAYTYNNLIFSGSGAKSMATGTSVTGNLSIAPTGSATASVGAGLNLSVGTLTLGGVGRLNGTWGSTTAISAANQNNTYFAATTGYLSVTTDTSPSAKDFLTFGPGAVINAAAGTVAWLVDPGTDVTTLAPTYTVSIGASGSPTSGTARNFTTPQTYTITAQDASTKVYTVTVTVSPVPVSGLIVWLKADAVNTGDGTQIRTSGSDLFVQQWNDSSGGGRNATNATQGDQPKYIANALNGKPAIRFTEDNNETGDRLYLGDLGAQFPTAASAFIVAAPNEQATGGGYTLFDNENNDGRWWSGPSQYNESTPGTFRSSRDGTFNTTAVKAAWPYTGSHVFALESSSSVYRYLVDGSNVGGTVGVAAYHSGSGQTMTIGNRWQGGGGGSQLNGDIGELILYNRVLTTAEANAVGGYLAGKYGVTTTNYPLPAPASPAGLTATGVAGAVNLSWTAATNATSYSVQRSTSSGAGYTQIGTATGTTYADTTGTTGTTYYYVVTATNSGGTSGVSNEVGAARLANAAKNILTFGSNISGSSVTINSGAGTIAWTVPAGNDMTTLAPAYTVSQYAAGSPASGTSRNFTTPQTYTITAEDNSTQVYTVTVTVEPGVPVTNGLIVWLKAGAVNTSDPAQVRTSGSDLFVQQWNDSSGAGRNATNATQSDQPKYIANALNGKPVIRFTEDNNDTGDRLYLGDLSTQTPTAGSAFIVATPTDPNGYTLFDNRNNDGRWVDIRYGESNPGTWKQNRAGGFSTGPWPLSGAHVYSLESSSLVYRALVDGTQVGSTTAEYNSGSGQNWTIGNRAQDGSGGSQLNGDIAEVILFNRVLTTDEANAVGRYLADKYGVTTSYPAPAVTPAAPTGLTATPAAGAVNLSWTVSSGSTTYNVERSMTSGGTYSQIGTSSGATYSDTTGALGTTYYYVVTSQNSAGTSGISNESGAARLGSPAKDILTFGLADNAATITGTSIALTVPYGTSVTALAPTYTVSTFATGSPVSGTSRNFATPQTYTVTAEDTTIQAYTVTVTIAPPVPGNIATAPAMWLDASQLTGLSDGVTVNTWADMSASANHAIRQSGSSSGYPKYVASGLNGKPVIRFNSTNQNTGDYFKFTRVSTIRTVFWVLRENAGSSNGPFLLGDDINYDFHRASSNGPLWDSGNANANVRGGTTKLMGTQVDGTSTSLPANSFQLVSLVTSGNVQANQVTQDRTYHGSWQGDIAEIIIYATALSSADEAAVGSYLAAKYGLTTAYPVPPAAPTGLAATPLDGSVSLGWTASAGATGYNVKRSTTSGSGYTQIGTTTSATTYSDSTVANGTTYYYVVTATNSNGESANSTEASALPVAATVTTTTLATSGTPSTYGGAVTLTATVTPTPTGGTVQFYDNAVALGSPVTVSGGQAQLVTGTLAAGSHPITATFSGTTGFAGSTADSMSQSVSQAGQEITFGALAARTYGDAPFALTATASSGLTVSYVSSDTAVASVTSGSVTIHKAGSTTLTASQAGDANFSSAAAVPQVLTVNKITPAYKAPVAGAGAMVTVIMDARHPATITSPLSGPAGSTTHWNIPNPPLTDNGQDPGNSNLVDSSGTATGIGFSFHFPSNDPWGNPALQMLQTGVYNPGWSDWGQCEISGLTAGHTYNLYIASARINPNERSKGTFRTSNTADNQTANVDCSSGYGSNSGGPRNGDTWVEGNNYAAFRNVIADSNGKILFTANENCAPHLVINGFQLVAAGAPTPAATPITYGQSLSASTLGGSFTGLGGATIPGSMAFTNPSTVPNAGTASQSVTFTPEDAVNYDNGTTTISVTVNPADQTITFGALAAKTYGDAPFDLTATASSGLTVAYVSSDPTVASVAGNTVTILKAGTTTLTASLPGDGNHNPATPVGQTLTVLTPYGSWLAAYPSLSGADALPDADPDGDGHNNQMEHAFGTDPTVSSSVPIAYANGVVTAHGQPTTSVTNVSNGVDYRAVFGRRKDYVAAGLAYTVQFSADLNHWVNSSATPRVDASDSTMDAVSVPYPLFIETERGAEKPTFFRVTVSSN